MEKKNFLRVFSIWFALTQIEMSAFVDTSVGVLVGWLAVDGQLPRFTVYSDITFTKFSMCFEIVHPNREHNEDQRYEELEWKRV